MVENTQNADDSPLHRVEVSAQDFPVTDVSLFSRQTCRAEVKRILDVDLEEGANELTILNLPVLEADSIQLGGTGDASVIIQSVTYGAQPITQFSSSPELKRLEEEAQGIEDALAIKQAAYTALCAYANAMTAEHVQHGDLTDSLTTIENQLAERAASKRDLEKRAKEIGEAIAEERARLQQQGEDNSRLSQKLTVSLAAAQAGKVELALSYAVQGPYFSPRYIVQCSSSESDGQSSVKLLYKASVVQNTGEKWSNIHLKLETSRPLPAGSHLPFLPAQHLSFRQEQDEVRAMPMMAMAMAAAPPPPAPRGRLLAKRKAVHAQADVSETGSSQSFVIPGRPTIPPDGSEKMLTISELELPATFIRAAVPKVNEQCFLKARIVNKSAYVLLAGPTTVTMDGAFVASSHLQHAIQPDERFELHAGADSKIKLSVTPEQKTNSKSNRFFGGDKAAKTVSHRINVKNVGRSRVAVAVFDQVAQSRNEQISVEVIEPAGLEKPPTSAQADAREHYVAEGVMASWALENEDDPDGTAVDIDGRLRFDVSLQPGESKTLDVAYKISWPVLESLIGI